MTAAPPAVQIEAAAKHVFLPIKSPGYNYKLPVKPSFATNMGQVWHGIGLYKNEPVQGGFQ